MTVKPSMAKAILLICATGALAGCRKNEQRGGEPAQPPLKNVLTSAQGSYQVQYVTNPDPIPLNEPFEIEVRVTSLANRSAASGMSLEVDGRMPHHRHGMNRQPTVTARGSGEFHVENMLFHMPGRWELYFDVTSGGQTERAQDVIHLD